MSTSTAAAGNKLGTERLLWGSVLGLLTFWLFAGSMGSVARPVLLGINGPYTDAAARTWSTPVLSVDQMNLAVAITAVFSGLFIVFAGGVADRVGRVKIALVGNVLGVVGSALVALAAGGAALPMMLAGRCIQGLAGACIMPATLALVKAYWDGPARQRAVSMWSLGTFGGSSLASLFGGFIATNLGWRQIFWASAAVSIVSFWMIWGTPESKVTTEPGERRRFDGLGLGIFMVAVLCLMVVVTFGRQLGWLSPTTLVLGVLALVAGATFVALERRVEVPFIDLALFRNRAFSGATLANLLVNASAGALIVSQQMLQLAYPQRFDAWQAGLLTLGFPIMLIGFVRVGEKLLQRFGAKPPMMAAAALLALACLCLAQTQLGMGAYVVFAVVGYALFGLGLASFATPATDAAISALPPAQAGTGSGIYKMASSLGSAVGVAISLAVFSGLIASGWTASGLVSGDASVVRSAGLAALYVNAGFCLVSLIAIVLVIPRSKTVAV